jgi:hypothetical protein
MTTTTRNERQQATNKQWRQQVQATSKQTNVDDNMQQMKIWRQRHAANNGDKLQTNKPTTMTTCNERTNGNSNKLRTTTTSFNRTNKQHQVTNNDNDNQQINNNINSQQTNARQQQQR